MWQAIRKEITDRKLEEIDVIILMTDIVETYNNTYHKAINRTQIMEQSRGKKFENSKF